MIVFGAPSEPRAHHLMHDGTSVWSTQILRSEDPTHPQAVLVEQSRRSVIKPHFHQTSQFQVAVAGAGTLNNHDLRPVAVHYALRQTSYGPIVAGEQGFAYLALRPARDPGPLWIPEDVAKLDRRGKRRQVTSAAYDVSAATASSHAVVDVLPLDESGLGSWLVRARPGSASSRRAAATPMAASSSCSTERWRPTRAHRTKARPGNACSVVWRWPGFRRTWPNSRSRRGRPGSTRSCCSFPRARLPQRPRRRIETRTADAEDAHARDKRKSPHNIGRP